MEAIKKVYRHEKKYTISWNEFQVINGKIKHLLKRDPHCPEDGYEVKSLYFDNPYDYALGQKVDGEELRHKYRIRVYNNNFDWLKLEKKSKHNIMTNKESVYLSKEEAMDLVAGEVEAIKDHENDFLKGFYYKIKHEKYRPKVVVKYQRIAYVYPVSNLRLTFDFNIRKSKVTKKFFSTDNGYLEAYKTGDVVMEVKFDQVLPTFLRSAIQSPHVMTGASSKYVAARCSS